MGELVLTSLTAEALPLIRYRTKDICILSRKKCSCGRTHVKMTKPMGRSDDMMIIRGVNVFPSQIEAVLLKEGYTPNYQIVVDRANNTDTFDIYVEFSVEQFSDKIADVQAREKALNGAMRSMLGIGPKIHLVAESCMTDVLQGCTILSKYCPFKLCSNHSRAAIEPLLDLRRNSHGNHTVVRIS